MRKEIIQAAYEEFSEKGYSASLSDIVEVLGLKKQSLYNYFDSKEELFLKMIERKIKAHYNEQLLYLESCKKLPKIEQLEKIFMFYIASFENPQKLKFWKRLLVIENTTLLKRTKEAIKINEAPFSKRLREILLEILEERPDLKKHHNSIIISYGSLIYGLLDGYLLYDDEENFEQYIKDVWNFFYQGLQSYLKSDITAKLEEGK